MTQKRVRWFWGFLSVFVSVVTECQDSHSVALCVFVGLLA